jgi:branched-chain amino acid transport system permease protein
VIGALAYTGLYDFLLARTESWRFVLGAVIVALVLAFPDGIAGTALRLHRKGRSQ